MCVTLSEPRFHQARGPSPEVSPRNLAVLYVPETIPERQNPCESRNAPSSSPNSLANLVGVQAETIQGNVGLLFENAPLGQLLINNLRKKIRTPGDVLISRTGTKLFINILLSGDGNL